MNVCMAQADSQDGGKALGTPAGGNAFDSWMEQMPPKMTFAEIVRSVNDSLRGLLDEVDGMDPADYLATIESLIDSDAWANCLSTPEVYETLLRLTIRRVSSISELDATELTVIHRVLEQEVPCNNLIARYRATIKSILQWS